MASSQCALLWRPLPTFVWSRAQGCGSGYMARVPAGSEEGRKPGVKGDCLLLLLSEQQTLTLRLSDSQKLNVWLRMILTSCIKCLIFKNYYTYFSRQGELKINNFLKWKQQQKKVQWKPCCVWTAAAWFLSPAPLRTGLSCNLERSPRRPQVQRVHEAYFRWACLDRPTKPLDPPHPPPSSPYIQLFSPSS